MKTNPSKQGNNEKVEKLHAQPPCTGRFICVYCPINTEKERRKAYLQLCALIVKILLTCERLSLSGHVTKCHLLVSTFLHCLWFASRLNKHTGNTVFDIQSTSAQAQIPAHKKIIKESLASQRWVYRTNPLCTAATSLSLCRLAAQWVPVIRLLSKDRD